MSLEIESVSKSFRGVSALEAVSLSVELGEIVALIGPAGAGKTTLLRLAAGLIEPDAGRVRVFKIDVPLERPRAQDRLGYVPAGAPIDLELTPWAYLRFLAGARGLDSTKVRHAVRAAAGLVGLDDAITRKGAALTAVERRLTALAAALLPDPVLLILDEPFHGLDDREAAAFAETLGGVARERAMLLSSRLTEPCARLANRIARIEAGRITDAAAAARDPAATVQERAA